MYHSFRVETERGETLDMCDGKCPYYEISPQLAEEVFPGCYVVGSVQDLLQEMDPQAKKEQPGNVWYESPEGMLRALRQDP